jgi:hypothetical protein
VNAKRVARLGRTLPKNSVFLHLPTGKMWQLAHFRFLTASSVLLAFYFQLFISGFSFKLFVLCLKRQTALILTLAFKGKIADGFKDDLNNDKSVRAAEVLKRAQY